MSTPEQATRGDAAAGAYALAVAEPDRPALTGPDGRELTFGQVGRAANRLANALRDLGIGRDDVVAGLLHNSIEHFLLVLATGQIGVLLVPINVHLTAAEVGYIITDSGAKALVAHADLAAGLAPVAAQLPQARFTVDGRVAGWRDYAELAAGGPEAPDDRIAGSVMGYTSGTTGRPKGVRRAMPPLAPEDMAAAFAALMAMFDLRPGPGVHLACSPLYHAAPGTMAVNLLHLGHRVVIESRFDAEQALRDIAAHRVTSSQMVPTHLHRIMRLPAEVRARHDVSSLTNLLVAGAPFAAEAKRAVLDWLGPVVWEYLGSTEGMVSIASPADALSHPGTVGRPLGEVRILDLDGRPAPTGAVGTIHFPLPVSFEYLNDPAKTAAAIGEGYATVGDLGRLDEDGYLYLLDRRDDLIIAGGVNIYPSEVEQRLILHPAVADVAVIGVPDPEWGQTVAAVVQLEPGWTPGDELAGELDRHCRAGLAGQKCPRRYEFRTTLPRTPSGKLLRRNLRDSVR